MNIIVALCSFLGGIAISFVNSKLTSDSLKNNKANLTTTVIFIRQILNIGYLLLVFLLVKIFNLNLSYALIGAAFGLTIPTLIFAAYTSKKLSESLKDQEKDQNG